MSFPRSILLLASVVLCVAFVLFTGYGLAGDHPAALLWGAGLLVLGAAAIYVQARSGRRA